MLAWLVIFASISHNPWFIFTKHAFSDLGGPYASEPWIYNYGLISIGGLVVLYSIYLTYVAGNKLEVFGAALTFVGGLFLALIGLFPTPAKPHAFISTWFFIQMNLAILAYGLSFLNEKAFKEGLLLLILGILGPIGAILYPWPSAATVEAYGIIIIDTWVIVLSIKSIP